MKYKNHLIIPTIAMLSVISVSVDVSADEILGQNKIIQKENTESEATYINSKSEVNFEKQNEISHIEKTFEEPIQEKSKPVESPFSLDKEHQPPVKDEILVQENTEKNARDNSHDKVKKTSELKVMKGKPEKTQEQNIANKNKASLSTDTD